jgi:hypothetical protein
MDAILSPNVPFVLAKGFFDGFPTGACMEAGICGVPVICTDELELNTELKDGHDIIIVKPNAASCAAAIAACRADRAGWMRLSEATMHSFRRVFGLQAQIAPRIRLLSESFQLSTS